MEPSFTAAQLLQMKKNAPTARKSDLTRFMTNLGLAPASKTMEEMRQEISVETQNQLDNLLAGEKQKEQETTSWTARRIEKGKDKATNSSSKPAKSAKSGKSGNDSVDGLSTSSDAGAVFSFTLIFIKFV
jgi:hypothetical protein